MSCSPEELKAYSLGELEQREKAVLEDHLRACQACSEELDRLRLTQSAMLSLEDEEIPRRIAFVSDRVFEPRWWQTIWRSGPAMGFASAALLAGAILVHAYERPTAQVSPALDTAQLQRTIEREVNAHLDNAVARAVSDSEARQSREFAKVLSDTTKRYEAARRTDLAMIEQASNYYEKQMNRLLVASNEERVGQ